METIERLKRGDVLHMQFVEGKRDFWFEAPFQAVSEQEFSEASRRLSLIEAGDSLFGGSMSSQSWRVRSNVLLQSRKPRRSPAATKARQALAMDDLFADFK